MIWQRKLNEKELATMIKGTMIEHLDIQVEEITNQSIIASMPINHKTIQPEGILHGGASAALSESMGSLASTMCIDINKEFPVGIEINATHLHQGIGSRVKVVTKPVKIGKKLHVWNSEIFDDDNKLLCVSKLSVMILKRRNND